jgi:hypothetical protein
MDAFQVISDLFKPEKKHGDLDAYLAQAEALAGDADGLQCNVTRDLEKLKVKLRC